MADMMSNDNEHVVPVEHAVEDSHSMEMVLLGIVIGVVITCIVVWVTMHGGTHNPDLAPNVPGFGN